MFNVDRFGPAISSGDAKSGDIGIVLESLPASKKLHNFRLMHHSKLYHSLDQTRGLVTANPGAGATSGSFFQRPKVQCDLGR